MNLKDKDVYKALFDDVHHFIKQHTDEELAVHLEEDIEGVTVIATISSQSLDLARVFDLAVDLNHKAVRGNKQYIIIAGYYRQEREL